MKSAGRNAGREETIATVSYPVRQLIRRFRHGAASVCRNWPHFFEEIAE